MKKLLFFIFIYIFTIRIYSQEIYSTNYARITENGVNCRIQPDINSAISFVLNKNDVVQVLTRSSNTSNIGSSTGYWYNIKHIESGKTAWVYELLIAKNILDNLYEGIYRSLGMHEDYHYNGNFTSENEVLKIYVKEGNVFLLHGFLNNSQITYYNEIRINEIKKEKVGDLLYYFLDNSSLFYIESTNSAEGLNHLNRFKYFHDAPASRSFHYDLEFSRITFKEMLNINENYSFKTYYSYIKENISNLEDEKVIDYLSKIPVEYLDKQNGNFSMALKNRNDKAVDVLISIGLTPFQDDDADPNPVLKYALLSNNYNACHYFITTCAIDPNQNLEPQIGGNNSTLYPLAFAVYLQNDFHIIDLLIKNGAQLEAESYILTDFPNEHIRGVTTTPLGFSLLMKNKEMYNSLLALGADENAILKTNSNEYYIKELKSQFF